MRIKSNLIKSFTLLAMLPLINLPGYSSDLNGVGAEEQKISVYTDEDLRAVAVETAMIKEGEKISDYDEQFLKENSIIFWILIGHEGKVAVIDRLKGLFEQRGIYISRSSEFYVSEMNSVIFISIMDGLIAKTKGKQSTGYIFKMIAQANGDFKTIDDLIKT